MSYTSEDWRIAITNLIKKTSKKEISWEHTDMFKADVWTEVDRSFKCKVKDKTYVVSLVRKKTYFDETEYYWESGYDFSIFVKEYGEDIKLASAPSGLNIVDSLYSTVDTNYAFSRNALGDLLE